jgi:DNA-binding HxlR family transcriptional regulator
MARKQAHDDGCGISHAQELLGQRWALVVVRELLLGPKRFTDLRSGVPGISPNVLSQRLRELEASGIVRHRRLAPPIAAQVYELTEWGRELEPAVLALGRWATSSPAFPRGAQMSPDSLVLALKSTFKPAKADGLDAKYELWLGDLPFAIAVKDGRLDAARGEARGSDAVVHSDPAAIAAVVFGERPLRQAVQAGDVAIDGSRAAATALFRALG